MKFALDDRVAEAEPRDPEELGEGPKHDQRSPRGYLVDPGGRSAGAM